MAVTNRTLSVVHQMRARVVEIGKGGVLVHCGGPVTGRKGRLRLPLGREGFTAAIEVRYERAAPEGDQVAIGAAFVDVPLESRSALERFLDKAPQ